MAIQLNYHAQDENQKNKKQSKNPTKPYYFLPTITEDKQKTV